MNETYEEYMHRKLLESVQYRPKEVKKITLYADGEPYQVMNLKDVDEMSEEEYNDKLKDAWFKKTHYETVEELTMAKYYNYEVEEEKNSKKKTDWSEVTIVILTILIDAAIIGAIVFVLYAFFFGG